MSNFSPDVQSTLETIRKRMHEIRDLEDEWGREFLRRSPGEIGRRYRNLRRELQWPDADRSRP